MKRKFSRSKRAIVGIEAAIVMIAFVVIAAAFAFMVVNMGLFSTQRSQEAIQQGLKEASCPLLIDGSILLKSVGANDVRYAIIPLKVLGAKYVPMWTNETIVSMKVGTQSALANMYAGINHDVDPTGMSFDEIISRLTTVSETVVISSGSGTLSYKPIKPSSVTITLSDGTAYTDDGKGDLMYGTTDVGDIDYDDGTITVFQTDGTTPYDGTVTATYETIGNSATVVGEKDAVDTATGTFSLDNMPVLPGSVTITLTVTDSATTPNTFTVVLTDGGDGKVYYSGNTRGTIDYALGSVTIDFNQLITDHGGTTPAQSASAVTNYKYIVNNFAKLVVENDDGDDSLSFYEKGYLIIILDASHKLQPRDGVVIEVRPEKSAPLTVSFTVPEAIPPNSYVTLE